MAEEPQLDASAGRFAAFLIGETAPAAIRDQARPWYASVSAATVAPGCDLMLRADGVIDAIYFKADYRGPIVGSFCVGDPAAALFQEDKPFFAAEFRDYASHGLYFVLTSGMGMTVHMPQTSIEDGPFNDADWLELLATPTQSVVLARDDQRELAY